MPIASSDIDRADDPSGYPVATLADSNSRLMQVIVPVDATGEKALVSLVGAAASATAGGVAALAVRDDALSALSDAEGDWVVLRVGSTGALWVRPDVAYGAGAVDGTVQRATLASDDPAVTALQVLDDWDESDRAKVNLIAGQAGITAGAGAVGASTPRVTLASDDPAVAALGTIDADTSVLAGAVSGTEMQVDVVSLPAVDLGATDNAVLDDIATKLGTIDADTSALAGAVAGTEVQVDVVAALPAGTNVVGATHDVSGLIVENAAALTVKYAVIDFASSGDNTVVAAVTDKKIRVLSLFLVAAGAVDVRFESGAGGTALTGQMNLVANTGFVLPYNPHGWFQSGESALLNLELSAAVSVDGSITYIEAE